MKFLSKKRLSFEGKLIILVIMVSLLMDLSIPKVVSASESGTIITPVSAEETVDELKIIFAFPANDAEEEQIQPQQIDLAPLREPQKSMVISATAYNSTVSQCDASPCIAARGFNLCEHNEEDVIAANFLPIDAEVRFPELYGDKIFTVVDRMHPRYNYRVDFWKKDLQEAKEFGVRRVKIEIF